MAYLGANSLRTYLHEQTTKSFEANGDILENTTNIALRDTVKYLDKKSQESLEKITFQIAEKVADFLNERDKDILLLSELNIDQNTLNSFYKSKTSFEYKEHDFIYDDKNSIWKQQDNLEKVKRAKTTANLEDNQREFNFIDPFNVEKIKSPIYKEVSYFDLNGNEIYKVSQINKKLLNISKRENTYINSENYFNDIQKLKKGEIYVSDVIGEYVSSKVIGVYTKEKTSKMGIEFEPQKSAYAGKENPVGKKFEAIIRFITPVFKNHKKVGYVSLALDHKHIMKYTDNINPITPELIQLTPDASSGNYSFMWDYEGRSISHPRDYFIVGFDKKTGKRVMPWLSADLASKYYESEKEINEFLNKYPKFEEQSLKKKPNLKQLKTDGNIALDCRYLNFAPQCEGWMQITQNGGYGSFIIFWSNVWKLTTAAVIPYYTGQYGLTKRGFGFVTIGANVEEFHAAANKTISRIDNIVNEQKKILDINRRENNNMIDSYLKKMMDELSITTLIMVIIVIFIAIWMSNYISNKIEKLVIGTKYFSKGDFDYEIKVTSNDEIGQLEKAFNSMSQKIKLLLEEQQELNKSLEKKVEIEVKKQAEQQKILEQQSKLASMGEMIGNIAHQWRQPLNALGLLIQSIEFKYNSNNLNKENLHEIVNKSKIITKSMSETIEDFMQFFNPKLDEDSFSLDEAISKAVKLFNSRDTKSSIEINNELGDIRIVGNQNRLIQVLLNLLTNAKDSVDNCYDKRACIIKINLKKDNNYIIIQVQDNGDGVPEELLDRIFEPYFTTKFKSQGTGIGLYMSKVIIEENMKGSLIAKNTLPGAMFEILLPIDKK